MAYASRQGRARISARSPEAAGRCDRCGFIYSHSDLSWQMDWAGPTLQNLRILVCNRCYDDPQDQNRSIVITADPVPIKNPRPEFFTKDEAPGSDFNSDFGPDFGGQPDQNYSPTGYPNELLFLVQLSNIGALPYLPKTPPAASGAYWNDNHVLSVTAGGLYPLPTTVPYTGGTFWNDGGVVSVTPGGLTIIPVSMPPFANLLWNNGGVICIS